jgi:hypothetical protein
MTKGFHKFTTFDPFSFKFMIPALIPPARLIVCHPSLVARNHHLTYRQPTDRSRAISKTLKSIRAIGRGMIAQKKAEIHATSESDAKGGVEKRNIQGRDLLSLLIRANMATDIPDTARMTDDEILARESKSGC